MKILIIGFSKIKYMPYVNFHLDNIDLSKNEVHLIFWNKDRKDDVIPKKDVILHEFSLMQCDAALRKILDEYNDAANAVKEACR